MDNASRLRRRAELYRRVKKQIGDDAALRAMNELTMEYEKAAEDLERQYQIRQRAKEIWIEHGRPEGRDIEIWLAAEREVDIRRRH